MSTLPEVCSLHQPAVPTEVNCRNELMKWLKQVWERFTRRILMYTLDLASGYWELGMAAELQLNTEFVLIQVCTYEFTVVSFELCNVPATFQRLMKTVLS